MAENVPGRLCAQCGAAMYRDGRQWRCRPCLTASQRRRRANLSADRRAAEDARANELRNARRAEWSPERRAQANAATQAWRDADPERHRAGSRDWYARNVERARAAKLAEYRRNPAAFYARNLVRKARLLNQVCDHGAKCVDDVFLAELYASACLYCGAPAEHADHFVPLARGGLHCRENVVPACSPCNLSKHDRDPAEWLAAMT